MSTVNEKLKPCPFCGTNPSVYSLQFEPDTYVVECNNFTTKCPMKACTYGRNSREEAIKVWNTRSAPTMQPWEWRRQGETEMCLDFQASVYRNEGEATWTGFVGFARFAAADTIDDAKAACVAFVQGQLDAWLA